jgi:hypothetical protein
VQQWVKFFNPDNTQYIAKKIVLDKTGNIYVTGEGGGNRRECTVKYSNDGNLIWARRDSNIVSGIDMKIDSLANIYILGSISITNVISTITTIKYDSSGTLKWGQNYLDSGTTPSSILIDNDLNIFSAGSKGSLAIGYTVLIKYSQLTGVKKDLSNLPKDYKLLQNYPNPFNPSTTINFQIPILSHITLSVYDILGREIAVILNENKNAGFYKIKWDGTKYPTGIYFYRLQTERFTKTKKMVLMR